MKLLKFKVTGFRSVEDSGWIDVSDVTSLIGENEAGKTNLLLPLWKFKPAGNGEISHLDDMPRAHYAEMRENPSKHVFITCVFELSDNDKDLAVRFGANESKSDTVLVTRNFDGKYSCSFQEDQDFNIITAYELSKMVEPEEGEEAPDKGLSLWQHFYRRFPSFVYYSNYGNLDAQIYLPHVVENLSREDLGAKEEAKARTLKVLFDLVNLSPSEVLELARATGVTERVNQHGQRLSIEDKSEDQILVDDEQLRKRAALLQSASSKLTKSFRDWWKQGDYRFRLQADGNYFRIWVADGRRTEEIELENRSTGLQWFLSFFLVFSYESEDTHENAIVLLDEPGHSLHPLAQRDLSAFFDSLAQTNQIIFTTHSPFMIDADRLDRVRKVYIDENGGTVASDNLGSKTGKRGEKDAGATYAVHSALNLTVAESLLIGCTPVIVEGPSDQHYLSGIKSVLISKGKIKPSAELVFPPSGGAKTAKIIASILVGRDEILPFTLLDGDSAGKQAAKTLKGSLYAGSENRVLSTDDFVDSFPNSEIEDLLPAELIISIVDRMERRADLEFEDFYSEGLPIVPQIKSWAEQEGFSLEPSWKVTLSLGVKAKLQANPEKHVSDELLKQWTALFKKFG